MLGLPSTLYFSLNPHNTLNDEAFVLLRYKCDLSKALSSTFHSDREW